MNKERLLKATPGPVMLLADIVIGAVHTVLPANTKRKNP